MTLLIVIAAYLASVAVSFRVVVWAMRMEWSSVESEDVGLALVLALVPGMNILFAFVGGLMGLFSAINDNRPGWVNKLLDRYTT